MKDTEKLGKPLRDLGIGTYTNLQFATMDTPVIDVIHLLVKHDISCIPIVDHDLTVLNVFEAVDVIILIKGGDYENLNLSVGKALEKRSEVSATFPPHKSIQDITEFTNNVLRISQASTPAPSTTASTPSSTPSASLACIAWSSSMRRGS